MIDDTYNLSQYFPYKNRGPIIKESFLNGKEVFTAKEYLNYHIDHFTRCAKHKLYPSAYYHLHIIYMIFVYTQLLRIAKQKPSEFNFCWIGLPNNEKDFLENPESPFSFSKINEKTVFRFFRILKFEDGFIANISSFVNKRNDILHANGEILYKSEKDLYNEYASYVQTMEKIIEKEIEILLDPLYASIVAGYEEDFEVNEDELETNFGNQYYLSQYELKLLAKYKNDVVSKFINNEW